MAFITSLHRCILKKTDFELLHRCHWKIPTSPKLIFFWEMSLEFHSSYCGAWKCQENHDTAKGFPIIQFLFNFLKEEDVDPPIILLMIFLKLVFAHVLA